MTRNDALAVLAASLFSSELYAVNLMYWYLKCLIISLTYGLMLTPKMVMMLSQAVTNSSGANFSIKS